MASPVSVKLEYYKGTYSSEHWALQPYTLADEKVIGLAKFKDYEYAIYVNPLDKRGCRCIVRLIKNSDMASTINKSYNFDEKRGMSLLVELVETAFRQKGMIAQTAQAGNNSHHFDTTTRVTTLGKKEEPNFLHTHVIGRLDPDYQVIEGINLEGPIPGLSFDMMGKTAHEPGNEIKLKWEGDEMKKAVSSLKVEVEKCKHLWEKDGLTVVTA